MDIKIATIKPQCTKLTFVCTILLLLLHCLIVKCIVFQDFPKSCAPCQDTSTIESCSHGYEVYATIYGIALELVEVTLM